MRKSLFAFIIILIFDILAVIVCFWNIVVFSGIISYLLWFIPIIVTIPALVRLFKNKKAMKRALIICLVLYCLTGLLNLCYWSCRDIIREESVDNRYYVTYEVNPGAMSHFSYQRQEYINLMDTPLLKVRFLLNSKTSRYEDGLYIKT